MTHYTSYMGAKDAVSFGTSYITLPHTRLNWSGSSKTKIEISLTTRDLSELWAAAPSSTAAPITLSKGTAILTGSVSGTLSAPRIDAHLAVNRFTVEGRQFDAVAANASASPMGLSVVQGTLARGRMLAEFAGCLGLRDWKIDPRGPIAADISLQNGDVADLMALAGQTGQDYSGALTAAAHVRGTLGNPSGSAEFDATNGTVVGEPFDRIDARIRFTDRLATLDTASLKAPAAQVNLAGEFQHPRDSFASGDLQVRIITLSLDLAQLRTLQRRDPGTSGLMQLSGDFGGQLAHSEFLLNRLQGAASAHALRFEGQAYGDLQASARTNGNTANFNLSSDLAGSNLRASGNFQLAHSYPGNVRVDCTGLPIERVLAIAHRQDIPIKGQLSVSADASGSLDNPQGSATVSLTNAAVSGEPITRVDAHINYLPQRADLSSFAVTAGPSHLMLSARFDHPAGRFNTGDLQFRIDNSQIDLAHLRTLQDVRPGITGIVQFSADGAARLSAGSPALQLTSLNAKATAEKLASNGQDLGGFALAAHTTAGNRLDFSLHSNLAGANIQAQGNGELGGAYPFDAQVSFSNVEWSRLRPLIGGQISETADFDLTTRGQLAINGPLIQPDQLHGSLEIPQLEFRAIPGAVARRSIAIRNQGPVQMVLDRGVVRLDSLHLAGAGTDVQVSGTVAVPSEELHLSVNAGLDLGLLENFNRDMVSSGTVKLTADVRGVPSNPQAIGSIELNNAAANYSGMPVGISNANGVVTLSGNRASIRNLTAVAGGGKLVVTGFADMAHQFRFALRADATNVRIPVQQGVSMVGTAELQAAGTADNSTLSGRVRIEQLNYAPRSDLASILTKAEPSVVNASRPQPLLDNMKLDVRVVTSSAMRVQASLAENLQIDANLQLRGTASLPSVLGRVDLTGGQIMFFGSTYTVDNGSIAFYNPVRIDPVLNVSLETQAQGVNVVLNVTGPVDNMKLTYTSDPPLEFEQIAALLSAGTTPTTNPNILANEPTPPPQTFEQRGESAILGQAVADPIANRLQRVFGITQLQISPTVAGASALPTAQVTLQQQVSTNITFTYISAFDNPNSTLISAQWALNPRWSAQAVRDQNGIFSINLFYKRQFR